jgi:hypothetical protein
MLNNCFLFVGSPHNNREKVQQIKELTSLLKVDHKQTAINVPEFPHCYGKAVKNDK